MSFSNIEIKARTSKPDFIRQYLSENGARFIGIDHQTDTYFNIPAGRLKLRQGTIENTLIFYERSDHAGPKHSVCRMMEIVRAEDLCEILRHALGIRVVVKKKREIYFAGNVKIHLDELSELGFFVEVEASDKDQPIPVERLGEQCNFYRRAFLIEDDDLIACSYSDMLLTRKYAPF